MIHTSIVSSLEGDWPTFSRKKVEREAWLRNIAVRRLGRVLITVDNRRGFVNDPKVYRICIQNQTTRCRWSYIGLYISEIYIFKQLSNGIFRFTANITTHFFKRSRWRMYLIGSVFGNEKPWQQHTSSASKDAFGDLLSGQKFTSHASAPKATLMEQRREELERTTDPVKLKVGLHSILIFVKLTFTSCASCMF